MNHFFFRYAGNKRQEAKNFINKCSLDCIENVYELFCGSSSISFNLWLIYGDKYNYYLNDNSKMIIDIYNTFKNEPLQEIEKKIKDIKNSINNKEDWVSIFKNNNNNDVYLNIFFLKYSKFGKLGFYDNDLRYLKKDFSLNKLQLQFLDFIKSPNVHISCDDWFNLFDKNKDNNKALFIFDPPYMDSCNDFYLEKNINIYEYFYKNKMENFRTNIYFILEDTWIVRMLFENNEFIDTYGKKYQVSGKKTTHVIIKNRSSNLNNLCYD